MATRWFIAKDTPSDQPVGGRTIGDKDWRSLQTRAAKADPDLAQFGTERSVKASRRGRDNYRNRHRN